MRSNFSRAETASVTRWQMPIIPEDYDRSSLTDAERRALEHLGNASGFARGAMNTASRESFAARSAFTRLDQPFTDIFRLRHQDRNQKRLTSVHFVIIGRCIGVGRCFGTGQPTSGWTPCAQRQPCLMRPGEG